MDPTTAKLLVVDDDEHIRTAMGMALRHQGYLIQTARSGHEALERLQQQSFDAILLDLRMPGVDGMAVMEQVCALQRPPAIIVLTAHPTVESAVAALRAEAVYDYLTKPVSLEELSESVERALRQHSRRMQLEHLFEVVRRAVETLRPVEAIRASPPEEGLLHAPPIILDMAKRLLSVAGDPPREVELTEGETKLLAMLMNEPNRVLSLAELAQGMGYSQIADEAGQNIVRSCIFRLRQKIEQDSGQPKIIRTVRGRGYFLATE